MKRLLALLLALVMFSTAFATPVSAVQTRKVDWSQLTSSACRPQGPQQGKLKVAVNFDVTNDADSKVGGGNAWAMDSYKKQILVWDLGDDQYCAVVKYLGTFDTIAGDSPQGTGTVGDDVRGHMQGGYRATFTGTFDPQLPTNGNIGPYDYTCNPDFSGCNYFDWLGAYFSSYADFDQPYWAWFYNTRTNGSWLNASTGNQGDITGN